METGKNHASAARAGRRCRSAEVAVADNIDPTATTTETFSHLVTDQVRCHRNVVDVVETTPIIGLAQQFDCHVLTVVE